ncbi:hypothetical protein B0T22DRAFT_479737 [Podospora appendiculata]|uniref:Uncharacterized protein n=1 Tax=Podospora appendiculata TaxID=314037 RepID=A0AAE0X9Z2_9PEZI|nr:hypothetical protein B0T22DRAFT_479737 [Podospora appendiculata]
MHYKNSIYLAAVAPLVCPPDSSTTAPSNGSSGASPISPPSPPASKPHVVVAGASGLQQSVLFAVVGAVVGAGVLFVL